ncbi:MAG: transposase [Chloroflexota bacterium]
MVTGATHFGSALLLNNAGVKFVMPVPRPSYVPGSFYHFYNRGAHRESIFREPDNYLFVIKRIKQVAQEAQLTVIAYCLLPNHYHFLVRQDSDHRAGLLPQRVFNSYSKAYNKRYDHSGTLFESNYHVKLIAHPAHLYHLCRYIHANPVRHGLVRTVEEWPYSNYLEWVGERDGTLIDPAFVQEMFGSAEEYRTFVYEYLLTRQHPDEIQSYMARLD